MANPNKKMASHGQSGDADASRVPEHKTWGGAAREEVAGGPEGRGNGAGDEVNTSDTWSRGVEAEGTDDQPVHGREGGKNPFSK